MGRRLTERLIGLFRERHRFPGPYAGSSNPAAHAPLERTVREAKEAYRESDRDRAEQLCVTVLRGYHLPR